jgi:hypothetical protein
MRCVCAALAPFLLAAWAQSTNEPAAAPQEITLENSGKPILAPSEKFGRFKEAMPMLDGDQPGRDATTRIDEQLAGVVPVRDPNAERPSAGSDDA